MAQPNGLSWFSESVNKVVLVVFLIACFDTLFCSQTLAQEIEVSTDLELKTGTRDGLLTVTAEIPDNWHTYSLTQPEGGPIRSTLKLEGTGIQLIGDFVGQQQPEKHDDEFLGALEELRGTAIWVARVQVSSDVDLAKLQATIGLYAQICNDENQQCTAPTTYSGEVKFLGEQADLELPPMPDKEPPTPSQAGSRDTEYFKLIETDTPEQIASMAKLYDVNEPIKYIPLSRMHEFPVGPGLSKPTKPIPLLLKLLLAFILGAMVSLMVYMLFNRSVDFEKTAKQKEDQQDDDQPVYPRMRQIAFAACVVFSICIVANVLLMIAQVIPWTTSEKTQQAVNANTPTGSITWANWHPGKVNQQLNQNKIVWVTYTVGWQGTSKVNQARIALDYDLIKRLNEMEVSFVAVDLAQNAESELKEFERLDDYLVPVNFIYPPNYPEQPAIKLDTLITPPNVHQVLDRMEAITANLKD